MRKITDPKNLAILLFFLLFSAFQTGKAQEAKSIITIQLKDKNFMTVRVCSDNIFRIRISEEADPGQSLLERYGILKSDWSDVNSTIRKEKNITVIQSGKFRISLNKETGNISVKDLNNKGVISSINIYPKSNSSETREVSESIQKYFAGEKHSEGIIGDENYLKAIQEAATQSGIYYPHSWKFSWLQMNGFTAADQPAVKISSIGENYSGCGILTSRQKFLCLS